MDPDRSTHDDDTAAKWVPLADVHRWARNPRKNQRTIEPTARSIKRFGWGAPIVARRADHEIIAGHTRIGAAERLIEWWAKATSRERQTWHPDAVRVAERRQVVVRFVDLTEHDAHLLALADNKIPESSTFDDDALGRILRELRDEDVDLVDGTGFVDREIERLIGDDSGTGGTGQDPGDLAPAADPVSRLGEVYLLGPHRLMCGDSTSAIDVQRLMDGARAVLCATDPPYLVDYDGDNHPQSFEREAAGKDNNRKWDAYIDPAASVEFFAGFLRVARQHALVENPAFYQWHASRRQALVEAAWEANGLFVHQQIIWVKARPILTRSHFMWQHEPCFYGWVKGSGPELRPPCSGECTTVWTIDQKGEQDGIHPTQKPVEIFARPIAYHTKRGDLVYEPFGGSGTQIIAAAQAGRRCNAMELSPAFCDAIRQRWTGWARSAGIDPGPGALDPP